jgi:hypothetical protein
MIGLLVFGAAVLGDALANRHGFKQELIWGIDDLFAAGVSALLVFYLLRVEENKRRTIAEMNHHVRNALAVIKGVNYLRGEHEQLVDDAIARVEWALRVVLESGGPLPRRERDASATSGIPLAKS